MERRDGFECHATSVVVVGIRHPATRMDDHHVATRIRTQRCRRLPQSSVVVVLEQTTLEEIRNIEPVIVLGLKGTLTNRISKGGVS
jgi:hypothetical protein